METVQDESIALVGHIEHLSPGARKLRAFYDLVPGAPIVQAEFGFYSMDRWKREGHIGEDTDLAALFGFDPPGEYSLKHLGWCEAPFVPAFETKVLEDREEYELVQDFAGRHVLFFKGRRSGFMPEYVNHPVKDLRTWEEDVKWRLDPASPEQFADLDERMAEAKVFAAEGWVINQNLGGGYM
jgi:hypothetical protein